MVHRSGSVDDALCGNDAVRAVLYTFAGKGWQMTGKGAPGSWMVAEGEAARQLIPISKVAVVDTAPKSHHGGVLVPRTSEHWELHKQAIEDLYLRQNKRLQDVMDIMAEEYQFRATSRMYKRQFAKWKWTKYNIQSSSGAPPTGQAFRGAFDKSCKRLRASKRSPSPRSDGADMKFIAPNTSAINRRPGTDSPSLTRYSPEPDDLTSLRCGLMLTVREYLKASHNGSQAVPTKAKEFTIGCDSWHLVGLLDLALDKLRGEQCDVGGRLLRHIFRDIGKSLNGICLQTSFGLCLQMPDYILRHGRLDILMIYLTYLTDLCRLRLPNHPLTLIVGMLKDLGNAFPACLPLCLGTLSQVWVDDLGVLRGPIDIHVLSARYQVQVAKENSDSGGADVTAASHLISDFGLLLREATDAADPTVLFLEDQILHLQWRFDAYEEDFVPRSRNAITNLLHKHDALPFARWPQQDLLVYQRCHLRLMEFLYRTGRLDEAHVVATRAIEATDDSMRLRWSGYLEQLLRWMDRHADADEVGRRWGELPLLGELEREDRDELSGIPALSD